MNDTRKSREELQALQELKASRGWQILMDVFKEEVLNAALGMASTPNMPEAEMHFRRGCIYAAQSHASVLDTLIALKENEVLMASAQRTPDQPDATA